MLLVSEEKRGFATRAVGGGPAADTAAARGPRSGTVNGVTTITGNVEEPLLELEIGELRESFHLEVGAKCVMRYLLKGEERIEWNLTVADGYTVEFGAKVCVERGRTEVKCHGRRVGLLGVDNGRVISEPSRNECFYGFFDLGGEHKGCLGNVSDARVVLALEVDNRFSFFTSKDFELHVRKLDPALKLTNARQVDACKPEETGRRTMVMPRPSVAADEAAGACAGHCVPVTSQEGRAPRGQITRPSSGLSLRSLDEPLEDGRLIRMRTLLVEAARLCPADAHALREQLRLTQARFSEYATEAAASEHSSPLG